MIVVSQLGGKPCYMPCCLSSNMRSSKRVYSGLAGGAEGVLEVRWPSSCAESLDFVGCHLSGWNRADLTLKQVSKGVRVYT
jgi:hypothetical protein